MDEEKNSTKEQSIPHQLEMKQNYID